MNSPAGGLDDPWGNLAGGNPFPYTRLSRFPASSDYYFVQSYNSASPRVHTWNLSIQRQIPASFLISASYLRKPGIPYVGRRRGQSCSLFPRKRCKRSLHRAGLYDPNHGNLLYDREYEPTPETNPAESIGGAVLRQLVYQEDSGTQHYHGMLLSIQRRAASGVNIGANYTWSHCIGIDPTANNTGRGGPGYLDPNNRKLDIGNCNSTDQRQVFNLTAVAPTPRFSNPTLRMLGTGWQVSSIYRWRTGQYMTVNTGLDRVLSGQAGNQRANQILGNPYGDRNSLTNYLNPNAFAQPALGTLGTCGRSTSKVLAAGSWIWGWREVSRSAKLKGWNFEPRRSM